MRVSTELRSSRLIVKVDANRGCFDFSFHDEFFQAMEIGIWSPDIRVVEIDFSLVGSMDSSAIGLLVRLSEGVNAQYKEKVIFRGVNNWCRQSLETHGLLQEFLLVDDELASA